MVPPLTPGITFAPERLAGVTTLDLEVSTVNGCPGMPGTSPNMSGDFPGFLAAHNWSYDAPAAEVEIHLLDSSGVGKRVDGATGMQAGGGASRAERHAAFVARIESGR